MKKKLGLPIVVAVWAVLGAAAGAGFRLVLPPSGPAPKSALVNTGDNESGSAPAQTNSDQAAAREKQKRSNDIRKDGSDNKLPAESGSYFKFSRQFVAPVIGDGGPEAMIVLDVVLELSPNSADSHYSIEPKLRDAVLRALLSQSGKGELKGMLSDPSSLEATRQAIFANVRDIIGDNARSVLLLDVAYQPF